VKKVLLIAVALLALAGTPAMATSVLAIPAGLVNFDGNGHFDQTIPGVFDMFGPLPALPGTELFGIGTISGVAMQSDLGVPVWLPSDVGPNFELTYSLWDAVVTSSTRTILPDGTVLIHSVYADEAQLVLVCDDSKDFDAVQGGAYETLFDTVTGDYPTAYTLPPGGAAADPNETLYLSLSLSVCSSDITWTPGSGFIYGQFASKAVEITGGSGAAHFMDYIAGPDGEAFGFITTFSPTGWAYGGDTDIKLRAIPEPTALISLCAGLVLLGGYRLRRRV